MLRMTLCEQSTGGDPNKRNSRATEYQQMHRTPRKRKGKESHCFLLLLDEGLLGKMGFPLNVPFSHFFLAMVIHQVVDVSHRSRMDNHCDTDTILTKVHIPRNFAGKEWNPYTAGIAWWNQPYGQMKNKIWDATYGRIYKVSIWYPPSQSKSSQGQHKINARTLFCEVLSSIILKEIIRGNAPSDNSVSWWVWY